MDVFKMVVILDEDLKADLEKDQKRKEAIELLMKDGNIQIVTAEDKNRPSIKLIKNTKGYSWEIKHYSEDLTLSIDLLTKLDNELKQKFGGEQNG